MKNIVTRVSTGSVILVRKTYLAAGVIFVICLLATIWISLRVTAQYNFTARLEVTQAKQNDRVYGRVSSTIYDNVSRGRSNTDTSKRIIKNRNKTDKDKLKKDRRKDTTKYKHDKSKTINTVLSHRKIVVIVGYMRSGSTLTGSVFQAYPDTFYSHEPLRYLSTQFKELNNIKTHVELKYINGTKRKYSASEKDTVIANEINSWLSCNLESISIQTLQTSLHRHFMKYKSKFQNCINKHISKSCLQMAIRSCHKAPLVALKFIRLRVKNIAKFLTFYPNMKIVHLVRDPRGVINSRMNSKAITENSYRTTVQGHCKKLQKDHEYSKKIQQTNSDKVKTLYYEDLAEHPLETVRSLIEFVGLKFVKSMQNKIEQQTHASHDAGAFSPIRRNSTETASKWRSQIDLVTARYIDKICKNSMSDLGYLPLDSVQMLRDQTIPSKKIQQM